MGFDFIGSHTCHLGFQLQVHSWGGEVPTSEPQETIKNWLIIMKFGFGLFYAKIFMVVVLRVGSSFC